MTDIKVGDRVTVTFEATVTDIEPYVGYDFDIMPDGIDEHWDVKAEWCTKILPPLPTKPGAVIRARNHGCVAVRTSTGAWRYEDGDGTAEPLYPEDWEVLFEGVDS